MSSPVARANPWHAVIPVLEVRDVETSITFYRDVLGFEESFRYRSPASYGGLARDGFEIHLRRVDHRPRRSTIYVPTPDVDAAHAAVAGGSAKIRNRPADQLYGMREFDLEDPDGHVICFGQCTDRD